MSKGELLARSSAWLEEAVARAKRDQKCWAGGDGGHQQAQAKCMEEPGPVPGFTTVTLRDEIERAFAHRGRPQNLIEIRSPITPEQKDALWFAGRDWREVEWQDWEDHSGAFYALVPEAFTYYLPSVLVCAITAPVEPLMATDALIGVLDRSPEVYHWDAFITSRLLGLQPAEYASLKDWVFSLSGLSRTFDEDSLTRAYETVELLARETTRLRDLLK